MLKKIMLLLFGVICLFICVVCTMTVVSSWIYAGWIEAIFCTIIGSITAIGWRAIAWVMFDEAFSIERKATKHWLDDIRWSRIWIRYKIQRFRYWVFRQVVKALGFKEYPINLNSDQKIWAVSEDQAKMINEHLMIGDLLTEAIPKRLRRIYSKWN